MKLESDVLSSRDARKHFSRITTELTMNKRFLFQAAFILASFPLAACSSGDDDSSKDNGGSGGTSGTGSGGGGGATQQNAWVGHTYALLTKPADWYSPKNIGKDVENVMPAFLFQVSQGMGSDLNVRIGTAKKIKDDNNKPTGFGDQDLCTPTIDLTIPAGKFPSSQMGPFNVPLHLFYDAATPADTSDDVQVTATVTGLEFTDVLPAMPGATDGVETSALKASMNVTEIAPLFTALGTTGHPPSTDTVCNELQKATMVGCLACPSGGTSTCFSAVAQYIVAIDAPGVTVKPVDLATRPDTCKNTY